MPSPDPTPQASVITIYLTPSNFDHPYYTVVVGERVSHCLGWDEMLGLVAERTRPDIRRTIHDIDADSLVARMQRRANMNRQVNAQGGTTNAE